MENKIFYGIMLLFFISVPVAFAQESIVSVQTDDTSYDEGDTIVISGNVGTVIKDTPILVHIIFDTTITYVGQLDVAQDGGFTDIVIAKGPMWKKAGNYIIKTFYQEHTAETMFTYLPKTEIQETKTIFEVSAGSHGTFDVQYSIKGGVVKDMVVDSNMFALRVEIKAPDEGSITLDLPRGFIGAEKQDGKDVPFITLINGTQVPNIESAVLADYRVITTSFTGDSNIEIIGTYIVPEFGAVAMTVLIIGIMTVLIFSRNKFQIRV